MQCKQIGEEIGLEMYFNFFKQNLISYFMLLILRWNMTHTHSWQFSHLFLLFIRIDFPYSSLLGGLWRRLCVCYLFLFLNDKAYRSYTVYVSVCMCRHVSVRVHLWVSVSVLWCSGRAVQTVECLVTWRSDSTAVLAAFRAGKPGEPVTQQTHTQNLKKDTAFRAQRLKLACIISVVLALAFK